jgi:hypothetical protein
MEGTARLRPDTVNVFYRILPPLFELFLLEEIFYHPLPASLKLPASPKVMQDKSQDKDAGGVPRGSEGNSEVRVQRPEIKWNKRCPGVQGSVYGWKFSALLRSLL